MPAGTMWKLDLAALTWTQEANMPVATTDQPCQVGAPFLALHKRTPGGRPQAYDAGNDLIYVVGGRGTGDSMASTHTYASDTGVGLASVEREDALWKTLQDIGLEPNDGPYR